MTTMTMRQRLVKAINELSRWPGYWSSEYWPAVKNLQKAVDTLDSIRKGVE